MWRQPRLHELDAPPEFVEQINESIYFNRKGSLTGADRYTILQYLLAILLSWIFVLALLALLSSLFFQFSPLILIILAATSLLVSLSLFIYWGWIKYEEAWYHFDRTDRILTVFKRNNGNWEAIEIPYEQIEEVSWSGGTNGYAIISAAGFDIPTNRADHERFSSVTELWSDLASFDQPMTNWPILLVCPVCDRQFGHHIGTATCPFDEVLLVDPSIKGRIDPTDLHPDDYRRL